MPSPDGGVPPDPQASVRAGSPTSAPEACQPRPLLRPSERRPPASLSCEFRFFELKMFGAEYMSDNIQTHTCSQGFALECDLIPRPPAVSTASGEQARSLVNPGQRFLSRLESLHGQSRPRARRVGASAEQDAAVGRHVSGAGMRTSSPECGRRGSGDGGLQIEPASLAQWRVPSRGPKGRRFDSWSRACTWVAGFPAQKGGYGRQPIDVSLSHIDVSLSHSLPPILFRNQ